MAYLPGNFRQRVQELLKQHDMNAEDLAKLLGVSTDTVRRMLKASEGGEDGSPKVSVDAIVKMAKYFNVVDSFDTHANIPMHFDNVDASAKESGKIGILTAADAVANFKKE